MAVVKFISEKDCQLFIDMDYVGNIQTNSMLKTTLESGSYLVEIKDLEGTLLKKYELKISPEDAQVLQNITFSTNTIEDSIDKLKNNSSIRFYNQRAILKHNDKFGFIDSQYKVVIQPIYSFADNFYTDKAFVRRSFPDGEKATIIDTEGNICPGLWYDYIGSNEKTILLKFDKVYYVLNRVNYSIIEKYQDAGYNNISELIPVLKEIGVDNFYGFIDKTGAEIVPFIYDYVWNFEENGFARVKRFGVIHAVGKDGTLYYSMEGALKDGKTYKETEIINFLSDLEERKEIEKVYSAIKLSKEESLIKGFCADCFEYGVKEEGDDDAQNYYDCWWQEAYPIRINNKWQLRGCDPTAFEVEETDRFQCDRIIFFSKGVFVYRIGSICKLKIGENNNKEYTYHADEIIPNIKWYHTFGGQYDELSINNLIIKRNKKYGIMSMDGKILLPIEYDYICPTEAMENSTTGNIGLVRKDGKCSLVRMKDGMILEEFKYEDIIVNEIKCEWWQVESPFIVKENGKFGCVDFNRDVMLPPIYDFVSFEFQEDSYGYHYFLKLQKDGKVGTYEYRRYIQSCTNGVDISRSFMVEPDYDECEFLTNEKSVNSCLKMSFVAVRKGAKWGIIDNTPSSTTYFPISISEWRNHANLVDLEFKYDSLEELKSDADEEFRRRRAKYERPHLITEIGNQYVVTEI